MMILDMGMILFFGGFLSLVVNRAHLLMMLLSLEFLMLGVFLFLILGMMGVVNFSLVLFYLFVVVCEAGVGLGIMISLVSVYGGEMFGLMNLLQC